MNQRQDTYKFIKDLMEQLKQRQTNEEYLENYKKLTIIINRLSDKHISSTGVVNFEEDISIINETYLLANLWFLKPVVDFIINDLISFTQELRMLSRMPMINGLKNFKDEFYYADKLIVELRLIAMCYLKSRDLTEKNIVATILEEFKNIDIKKNDDIDRVSLYQLAKIIFHNKHRNWYLNPSLEEMENFILLLYKLGPDKDFPKQKFLSAMNVVIALYAAAYFRPKNNKIYHITNFDAFNSIINTNETWLKPTNKLNDPEEQKTFSSTLRRNFSVKKTESILEKDINNDYFSMSFTSNPNKKELILKYAKSIKNSVIIEYDLFSISNILTITDINQVLNKNMITHHYPIIGEIIYSKDKMNEIWDKILIFLNKLKPFLKGQWHEVAIKKTANICKAFLKNGKWQEEEEIRVILRKEKGRNIKYTKNKIIISPELLSTFDFIYAHETKYKEILKICKTQKALVESYEIVENHFLQHNQPKEKLLDKRVKKLFF